MIQMQVAYNQCSSHIVKEHSVCCCFHSHLQFLYSPSLFVFVMGRTAESFLSQDGNHCWDELLWMVRMARKEYSLIVFLSWSRAIHSFSTKITEQNLLQITQLPPARGTTVETNKFTYCELSCVAQASDFSCISILHALLFVLIQIRAELSHRRVDMNIFVYLSFSFILSRRPSLEDELNEFDQKWF